MTKRSKYFEILILLINSLSLIKNVMEYINKRLNLTTEIIDKSITLEKYSILLYKNNILIKEINCLYYKEYIKLLSIKLKDRISFIIQFIKFTIFCSFNLQIFLKKNCFRKKEMEHFLKKLLKIISVVDLIFATLEFKSLILQFYRTKVQKTELSKKLGYRELFLKILKEIQKKNIEYSFLVNVTKLKNKKIHIIKNKIKQYDYHSVKKKISFFLTTVERLQKKSKEEKQLMSKIEIKRKKKDRRLLFIENYQFNLLKNIKKVIHKL